MKYSVYQIEALNCTSKTNFPMMARRLRSLVKCDVVHCVVYVQCSVVCSVVYSVIYVCV